jgi:hypothetical protein
VEKILVEVNMKHGHLDSVEVVMCQYSHKKLWITYRFQLDVYVATLMGM